MVPGTDARLFAVNADTHPVHTFPLVFVSMHYQFIMKCVVLFLLKVLLISTVFAILLISLQVRLASVHKIYIITFIIIFKYENSHQILSSLTRRRLDDVELTVFRPCVSAESTLKIYFFGTTTTI